ncbi:MAG: hypothetical protein AAF430_15620 [Myxococcota bacterium]
MSDEAKKRPYEAPEIRVVELDVMASFPDNCKMDNLAGGFGGAAGTCAQSSQPTVMCLNIGS